MWLINLRHYTSALQESQRVIKIRKRRRRRGRKLRMMERNKRKMQRRKVSVYTSISDAFYAAASITALVCLRTCVQYKFLLSVLCNVAVFCTLQQLKLGMHHNTCYGYLHVYSINSYLVYCVMLLCSVLCNNWSLVCSSYDNIITHVMATYMCTV